MTGADPVAVPGDGRRGCCRGGRGGFGSGECGVSEFGPPTGSKRPEDRGLKVGLKYTSELLVWDEVPGRWSKYLSEKVVWILNTE